MSHDGHFTTRRGFVGAMGFGALGLYATWAAYGASPLPFASAEAPADPAAHAGHGGGHGAADPALADAHGAARLSPAEFQERHSAFVKAFRQADGSIRPAVAVEAAAPTPASDGAHGTGMAMDHGTMPMDHGAMPTDHGAAATSHGDHVTAGAIGHDGHGTSMPQDHGATAMPTAGHGHADGGSPAAHGHEAAAVPPEAHGHDAGAHGGHGDPAGDGADAVIEVYLSAGRFAFEPDDLRLERGRTYRFHMMATDVAHGASIAFGRASRIVRLRPDTVTTLDLTFREAGRHLVYCTVYCGLGHDAMHASITVA